MDIRHLLSAMWDDYCTLNPQAAKIHDVLNAHAGPIQNDHIALRTLRHPSLGIDHLARPFLEGGYKACGEYHFKAKKLFARHYEPADPSDPKIFISELKLEECTPELQTTINDLVSKAAPDTLIRDDVSMVGRPWDLPHATYTSLLSESEYAGWFAAFGFRPNHFTVLVNTLSKLNKLPELNTFLKNQGYALNASGGEIKGSPADMLEQSSTLAEEVELQFSDGSHKIPACYYEFALRYPDPTGQLYQGFVAASADKIFESTDVKR